MQEALMGHLLADAALAGLVQNRVNWNTRPQIGAVPAIVLSVVSSSITYHMQGQTDLVTTRVQMDCWALSFDAVMTTARALRNALSGAKFTEDGVEFQGIFLDSERHFFEEEAAERFHRVSLDFIIWHSE